MEKLVKKFEELAEGADYVMGYFNVEDIAQESRLLALEFLIYANTKLGIFEELEEGHVYHATKYKELFEQFIDEYYENN